MNSFRNVAFAVFLITWLVVPSGVAASDCNASWSGGDWYYEQFGGSCAEATCGEAMSYAASYCGSSRIMIDFSCQEYVTGGANFSFSCYWNYWFD